MPSTNAKENPSQSLSTRVSILIECLCCTARTEMRWGEAERETRMLITRELCANGGMEMCANIKCTDTLNFNGYSATCRQRAPKKACKLNSIHKIFIILN